MPGILDGGGAVVGMQGVLEVTRSSGGSREGLPCGTPCIRVRGAGRPSLRRHATLDHYEWSCETNLIDQT